MREQLWKKLVPEDMAVDDDVDFARLARDFELTGGQIKNAIENAVMLALEVMDDIQIDELVLTQTVLTKGAMMESEADAVEREEEKSRAYIQ